MIMPIVVFLCCSDVRRDVEFYGIALLIAGSVDGSLPEESSLAFSQGHIRVLDVCCEGQPARFIWKNEILSARYAILYLH